MTVPTISLRFTFERGLLRLGPAWGLLAGAALAWNSAAGVASPLRLAATLLVALALVEPIWGGVGSRMLALARSLAGIQPAGERPAGERPASGWPASMALTPPMPYARPHAPLARLWLWLRDDGVGEDGLNLMATLLAMTGALALLFLLSPTAGRAALLSSLVVIVLAMMGAMLAPAYPATARLLGAAAGLALPWLLGLGLFGRQTAPPSLWLLVGGFGVLAFAEEDESASPLPFGLGYAAAVAALVWAGRPAAAGLAGLVCAVPAWRVWQGRRAGVARWHWLALAAATIGLAVG